MKIIIFLIIGVFVTPALAVSGPSIYRVDGEIAPNAALTIHGGGFGLNPLRFEWTGDNIENGDPNEKFSKENWHLVDATDNVSGMPAIYSNVRSHSGAKSILARFIDFKYRCGFNYDSGVSIYNIYVTFWVFIDIVNGDDYCQLKLWRITDKNTAGGSVGLNNFNWYNQSISDWSIFGNTIYSYYVFEYDNSTKIGGRDYLHRKYPLKKWFRIEACVQKASGPNVADGAFKVYILDGNECSLIAKSDGAVTHTNSDPPWRYVNFGQYFGNIDEGVKREAYVYFDDLFIQIGTQARVEIGNGSTWENCTHREVQLPTAWSDTEISLTFNAGSFLQWEQIYLYVIDADGNMNTDGYPIGASNPPNPASGLRVTPE